MSTKDVVAQNIFAHDALYRRSILLDQFSHGLKEVGLLQLLKAFPNKMSKLFIYSGDLSPEDVSEAVYVENEANLERNDSYVLSLFHSYICTLNSAG